MSPAAPAGANRPDVVPGGVLEGMLARVASEEGWRAWSGQVAHAGHCLRPVRVRGGAAAVDSGTGEVLAEYSTAGNPDAALMLACGDRRTAVCPACAEVYRRDTWQMIAAGLRGRVPSLDGGADAVPASVSGHPVVLATFTAPGFGAVHRTCSDGPCRARGGLPVCPHGARQTCEARHGEGDRLVGAPLCWDCYDYDGHALWHGAVPELWRRTVIYLYRALARLASAATGTAVTVRAIRDLLRVSYVKVAEYQKRAAVHLHAVIRLDGVHAGDPARVVAPPAWADAALLAAAIGEAAGRVAVPLPEVGGQRVARWGGQLDISPVADPGRAAAYLAKYASKTAGDVLGGLPPRRFTRRDAERVSRRVDNPHVMLLVVACWRLSRLPQCAGMRLDDYPHTLGFRGHFATRSRWYSVTRGTLRTVRRSWRTRGQTAGTGDPWARARGGDGGAVLVRDWRYLGTGWARPGDADLAATLARDHAAVRAWADIATVSSAGGGDGDG
ncbi:replication initiator [Actinomadura sp. 9N407]|uniref:replication initiator n=1 Tax=Actinomadura sp. 9N407 TaxID=3375154 RepID=UPI00378D0302